MDFIYPKATFIAGVDEVGRGPLVGAVVTAAVILDPANPIDGLMDSKKLSEKNVSACLLRFRKKHCTGVSAARKRQKLIR